MSRIGTKIATIRTAKGMDRKKLGKLIGVSEKFILEIESGKRVINEDLQKKISKVLGESIDELSIYLEEPVPQSKKPLSSKKTVKPAIKDVWHDAFDSVIKTIRIYDYSLNKELGFRQLPVKDNKIEELPKDKVAFLEIQDNDLAGFRIMKGDLALVHLSSEFRNNSFFLVEHKGRRIIRQIRKLEGDKLLLVFNRGKLATETISLNDIKILARMVRLEINLN